MGYTLIHADCFDWMKEQKPHSVTAIVTDPPYGVKEYSSQEVEKQRAGRGGLWRIPPSFDGHIRQAVPRFSVINDDPKERESLKPPKFLRKLVYSSLPLGCGVLFDPFAGSGSTVRR